MRFLFSALTILAACNSCNMVNDTIQTLEANRQAVDTSTAVIYENSQAIQEANEAIAENRRQLQAINQTLKKVGEESK